MTHRAWYLRCTADDVGDRAILVGDRGRIRLIAERLDDPVWLNEDRGLTTVTGTCHGARVTASAFGMGAPIAAIVLHELAGLGVHTFLRLGTVMCVQPAVLGDLVVAEAAIRREATSGTYVPDGYPAVADFELTLAAQRHGSALGRRVVRGLVDSADGFYTQMIPEAQDRRSTSAWPAGVVGVDMETSAVLAVGRALGVRAGSMCLATVDAATAVRMDEAERAAAERDMVIAGLATLTDHVSTKRRSNTA